MMTTPFHSLISHLFAKMASGVTLRSFIVDTVHSCTELLWRSGHVLPSEPPEIRIVNIFPCHMAEVEPELGKSNTP
jgi:hypothetical protein